MSRLKKLSERLPSLGGALDRSSKLPQLSKPISETSSAIVNPPSSGTSLTIEELDGDPSVSGVSKIIGPNDSLADDGDGQITLINRYPIGVQIILDLGGGLYSCYEVNSLGIPILVDDDPILHIAVNNIGNAILAVGDKVPMYYCKVNDSFFFGEQD